MAFVSHEFQVAAGQATDRSAVTEDERGGFSHTTLADATLVSDRRNMPLPIG